MANTKSAAKRARQSVVRNTRKTGIVSSLKTGQKKLRVALASGDKEAAKSAYTQVVSDLDKAAKRGVIHKNSADRKKATFNSALAKA